MYSRVANMHRIEDFGTISSETSLQIQYQKNVIIIISFCSQFVFTKRREEEGEKGPYLQVPIHKPLYRNSYISLVSFSLFHHTYLWGKGGEGQVESERRGRNKRRSFLQSSI